MVQVDLGAPRSEDELLLGSVEIMFIRRTQKQNNEEVQRGRTVAATRLHELVGQARWVY